MDGENRNGDGPSKRRKMDEDKNLPNILNTSMVESMRNRLRLLLQNSLVENVQGDGSNYSSSAVNTTTSRENSFVSVMKSNIQSSMSHSQNMKLDGVNARSSGSIRTSRNENSLVSMMKTKFEHCLSSAQKMQVDGINTISGAITAIDSNEKCVNIETRGTLKEQSQGMESQCGMQDNISVSMIKTKFECISSFSQNVQVDNVNVMSSVANNAIDSKQNCANIDADDTLVSAMKSKLQCLLVKKVQTNSSNVMCSEGTNSIQVSTADMEQHELLTEGSSNASVANATRNIEDISLKQNVQKSGHRKNKVDVHVVEQQHISVSGSVVGGYVLDATLKDCSLPQNSDENIVGNNEVNDHVSSNSVTMHQKHPLLAKKGVKKFLDEMKSLFWVCCNICKETSFVSRKPKSCIHHRKCVNYSAEKNMDPGPVPKELQDLTYIEEQLIARVHPVISVHKVKGMQLKYSGNVINFPQAVEEFAKVLPWRIEALPSIITVRTGGINNHCDFFVRAAVVRDALLWLKMHNLHYSDIVISEENLNLLPENGNVYSSLRSIGSEQLNDDVTNETSMNTVISGNLKRNSKVYNQKMSQSESNVDDDMLDKIYETGVPSLSSAHPDDHVRSVFNWPTVQQTAISEFETKSYIPKSFPKLFPYGYPDLRGEECKNINAVQFFKHLMQYQDHRFARHPRFRFFAFNSSMRWRALSEGNFYVSKKSDLKNKTAEELKRYLLNNPNALKNIMFYGNKLRGTRAFWKIRSFELLDMIYQLGLPTLFITLSAADYHWPDLYELLAPGKDVNSLTSKERIKLVEENPMIVNDFFLKRVQSFFQNIAKPHLKVKDYWYRIEYQHRGSPHIHGLLWLENAPDVSNLAEMSLEQRQAVADYFDQFVCSYHPSPSTPPADDNPCRRRLEDIGDDEKDLAELLNFVQTHCCTKGYCLRKNARTQKMECRFKFPKQLRDKSVIELNEEGEFEFFSKRNVEYLNKFDKLLVKIWRANMDIAPVLSYRALVIYLAKYVSKSEPKSKGLEEFLISCSVNEKTAKSLIQRILIQTCSDRDYSAQEVCHLLMGLPLVFCSRDFVTVNVNNLSSDWTPIELNQDKNEKGLSSSNKGMAEKYGERLVLKDMSLWEVAKNYNLPSGKRRSTPAVVRIVPKYTLKLDAGVENEKYYRQETLLHLPWDKNSQLFDGRVSWEEIYKKHNLQTFEESDELYTSVKTAQKNVIDDVPETGDESDLSTEEYMQLSAMLPNTSAEKTKLGKRDIDVNHDWTASSENYKQYGSLHELKLFIKQKKKESQDVDMNPECPNVSLNAQQTVVMNNVENQISFLNGERPLESTPKRTIIQGKAGTGKSLLVHHILVRLILEYGRDSFLLLAPTGIAALNIGGVTIHSGLSIAPNFKKFKNLEGEALRKFCNKMASVKFLIIDEYSMVGAEMLSLIDQRMRQGKGCNEDFGGTFVYILGDIRQLPPVIDPPLYYPVQQKDNMNVVRGKMLFSQFDCHIRLTECHRQNDTMFVNLLDRLSVGESTKEDYITLKSRFSSNLSKEEKQKFEDAMHLYPSVKEVFDYNYSKLENAKCPTSGNPVPVAFIPSKNNCPEAAAKDEVDGLPSHINLAVGCKVMLRSNLWTSKGLVNGAIGTVVDILYDEGHSSPDNAPEVVVCSFPTYTGPCLDDNLKTVPIPAISRYWTSSENVQCSRSQFPLSLCYACTIHKSQGLTLYLAVIDIGKYDKSCGITYVALSRVKTLSGLMLTGFSENRLSLNKNKTMELRIEREQEIFN